MKQQILTQKRPPGISTVLMSFLAVLMLAIMPMLSWAQGSDIEQGENGNWSVPVSPMNWITGNLNHNNSHYAEDQAVPYRLVLTGMPTDGTPVRICLSYALVNSGKIAFDFLTTYDCLDPHNYINHTTPELVVPAPGTRTAFKQVNAPIYLSFPFFSGANNKFNNVIPTGKRQISIWGADFTADPIEYVYFDSKNLNSPIDVANLPAAIADALANNGSIYCKWIIRFVPSSANVTMAWGGHISDKQDYGYPPAINTACGISGSSYHMSADFWDLNNDGEFDPGFGSRDLSLQAAAVVPTPICPEELGLSLCYNPTTQTNYAAGQCPGACAPATLYFSAPASTLANTYEWSVLPAATIVDPITSQTVGITFATPGEYTVTVALRNLDQSGGSSQTVLCNVVVTISGPPPCGITGDNEICVGETTSFTANTGSEAYTYSWTGPGNFTETGATISNLTVAGTYIVTVTDPATGCTSTCERVLTVNQLPIVTLDPAGPFCIDANAVQLNGLPVGGIYSGTGVSATGLFTPATAGAGSHVITYTYTDPVTTCTNLTTITIVVNPLPVVTLDPAGPFCIDADAVQLNGLPAGGMYTGDGVSETGLFTPATAGAGSHVITYTYTDVNTCVNTATVTIVVHALPVVSVNPAGPFCIDANPFQMSGNPVNGTFSGNGVSSTGLFNPATAGAGQHLITYTFTDANTCINFATTTVVVNPLPVVTLDPAGPFCIDANAVQLNGLPSGGIYSGNGVSETGLFTPATAGAGSHEITYTYTDGNTCVNTATITIVVNALPVVTLDPAGPFCIDANAVQLNGLPAGGTYSGNGVSETGLFTPATAGVGSHEITYTYTDGNTCVNSATITIVVNALPIITLNPFGPFCLLDNVIQLSANLNGGTYSGPGVSSSGMFTPLTAGVGSHTITYTYTDGNSCVNTVSTTIVVNPMPACNIEGEVLVCNNTGNHVYTGPADMATYSWSISGDGTIPGAKDGREVNVSAGAAGKFILSLTVTNSFGCSTTCTFEVDVTAICEPACTYTQGYYGNPGGLSCPGNPPLNTTQAAMVMAFTNYGANMVTFGKLSANRYFNLYLSDINGNATLAANNIFRMLPGGGQAKAIDMWAGGEIKYDNMPSWKYVPLDTRKNTSGKIMNGLLAQTIALWFNLQNNGILDDIVLPYDVLLVAPASCGDNTPTGPAVEYILPHSVVQYLNSGGAYGNTVTDLFNLANAYLGGETPGSLSPTDVAKAVDVINNAFDECGVLMGYKEGEQYLFLQAPRPITANTVPAAAVVEQQPVTELTVRTFPNPYTDVVRFEIRSATGGQGELGIYNMQGMRIASTTMGQVPAGQVFMFEYRMPVTPVQMLMYKMNIGNQQVTGKLLRVVN